MYLPDGKLSVHHNFTLARLQSEAASLMIVCACPPEHAVLDTLAQQCDSLCWKAMQGYDFSGYAIGLSVLADCVAGSDVFVMNDSVIGPFSRLTPFIDEAQWRLTGLSAAAEVENHLQSFALIFRHLDTFFMQAIRSAISPRWCYDQASAVILLQETVLARVASEHISVGSYWYTDGSRYRDLSLNCPEQLIDAGFPLLKRSLFGKFAGNFQDPKAMHALLKRLGHPAL
jgi:lipopolysaccharide biosynthesis protein